MRYRTTLRSFFASLFVYFALSFVFLAFDWRSSLKDVVGEDGEKEGSCGEKGTFGAMPWSGAILREPYSSFSSLVYVLFAIPAGLALENLRWSTGAGKGTTTHRTHRVRYVVVSFVVLGISSFTCHARGGLVGCTLDYSTINLVMWVCWLDAVMYPYGSTDPRRHASRALIAISLAIVLNVMSLAVLSGEHAGALDLSTFNGVPDAYACAALMFFYHLTAVCIWCAALSEGISIQNDRRARAIKSGVLWVVGGMFVVFAAVVLVPACFGVPFRLGLGHEMDSSTVGMWSSVFALILGGALIVILLARYGKMSRQPPPEPGAARYRCVAGWVYALYASTVGFFALSSMLHLSQADSGLFGASCWVGAWTHSIWHLTTALAILSLVLYTYVSIFFISVASHPSPFRVPLKDLKSSP